MMGSDNGNVGNALVHLVDAIRGHWINGRKSRRPLAGWTCVDLAQMATAMAHDRLDNQDVLPAVYEESLGRILAGSGGDGRRGPWRNNRSANRRWSSRVTTITTVWSGAWGRTATVSWALAGAQRSLVGKEVPEYE
jgi:hypothetical protein